jgi:PhnB protein
MVILGIVLFKKLEIFINVKRDQYLAEYLAKTQKLKVERCFFMILGIFPYLFLNGNGQEAIKFYEHALDAKVVSVQTFGDMPANPNYPTPPEAKDLVLNAQLKVGNSDLMLSDTFPGQPYQLGSQVTIAIMMNNVEKTKEVYEKLLEGGQILMPLQETFWSPSYGQVKDKYGVTWQVSTEIGDNN